MIFDQRDAGAQKRQVAACDRKATILHLRSSGHGRLTYPHDGSNYRLMDVGDEVVTHFIE